EQSDFDQLFGDAPAGLAAPQGQAPAVAAGALPPPPSPPAAAAGPKGPWGPTQQDLSFDVERIDAPVPLGGGGPGQTGLWLSPTTMTLLALLILVLLGLAFVGGLLVGRSVGG